MTRTLVGTPDPDPEKGSGGTAPGACPLPEDDRAEMNFGKQPATVEEGIEASVGQMRQAHAERHPGFQARTAQWLAAIQAARDARGREDV